VRSTRWAFEFDQLKKCDQFCKYFLHGDSLKLILAMHSIRRPRETASYSSRIAIRWRQSQSWLWFSLHWLSCGMLTLFAWVFLSADILQSLFGTQFFNADFLDSVKGKLKASGGFWLLRLLGLPTTALTILAWYFLFRLSADRRLSPASPKTWKRNQSWNVF
jgi:hypothetical protein